MGSRCKETGVGNSSGRRQVWGDDMCGEDRCGKTRVRDDKCGEQVCRGKPHKSLKAQRESQQVCVCVCVFVFDFVLQT